MSNSGSKIFPREGILNIPKYTSGKSESALLENPVKLSANENPYGPSKKAIEAFKASDKLEDMFPGRKTNPSQVYIPRCEHYKDNPPGDDWDGSWALTKK